MADPVIPVVRVMAVAMVRLEPMALPATQGMAGIPAVMVVPGIPVPVAVKAVPVVMVVPGIPVPAAMVAGAPPGDMEIPAAPKAVAAEDGNLTPANA